MCVYNKFFKTHIRRLLYHVERWNFAWKLHVPLKNEGDLKNKDDLKNEDELKNWHYPPNYFVPLLPLKSYLKFFLMTSHLDSHMTTDVKPDMLSGVQTGNGIPHDRFDIHGIAHGRTNRKDYIFMQRRLGQILHVYWRGARDL